MRMSLLSLIMVALVGCAPPASLQPSSPGPQVAGSGRCDAGKVAWAIGAAADRDTMARVWKESGAGLIRPLSPNQPTTRDLRPDRLNVHLDADNRIVRVDCG